MNDYRLGRAGLDRPRTATLRTTRCGPYMTYEINECSKSCRSWDLSGIDGSETFIGICIDRHKIIALGRPLRKRVAEQIVEPECEVVRDGQVGRKL